MHRARLTRAAALVAVVATVSMVTPVAAVAASDDTTTATADLRAAARAWAEAFLTGSARDIEAMQGPECRSPTAGTAPDAVTRSYLRRLRVVMRDHFGKPLDQIEILGVSVRNVTADHGEARVRYALPRAKTGNDNWVEYARHGGRWKVSNCHAPIGGESRTSESSSAALDD